MKKEENSEKGINDEGEKGGENGGKWGIERNIVGRMRIERMTRGLKVHCSTN